MTEGRNCEHLGRHDPSAGTGPLSWKVEAGLIVIHTIQKWHYVGWAAEHQAHTMYLKVPSCKKDGNQIRICWCSPASGSKGYRKQQQGRGLKFLNLPGDYKWISYRPQDWGIRISCPWFSCYLHMEFRVNHFSPPQLPPSRHSDIQPLLATVWKKAKHYYSALLLKAGLAYHQLCRNIDRSTIFIPLSFAPPLFPPTCCARGPCCHLTGDSHSPLLQRWSTETQSKLRPFTCYWNTNKQEAQKSFKKEALSKWSAHFQS